MKNEKIIPFILPLVCVVLGAFAFTTADTALQMICYLTSLVLILLGIFSIVRYLRGTAAENFASNGFVTGCILLLLGVVAIIRADSIALVIPFILGFLIAVNGIRELQNAIDVCKLNLHNSWIVVAIALVNLIVGVVLMINPGLTAAILMKVIGCGLIASGLADFVTTMVVLGKSRKTDSVIVEGDAEDDTKDDTEDNI